MGLFIGRPDAAVQAAAAASLQPSVAACILPVGLCMVPGEPLVIGQWYTGKFEVPCERGVCNYLDIEGLTHGTAALREAIQGPGLCGVSIGSGAQQAAPGNRQTLAEAWNSRFGIYKQRTGSPNPTDNQPDFTGYAFTAANWPARSDAFQAAGGYLDKKADYAAYDNSDGLNIKNPPYKDILTSSELGSPQYLGQDRRMVYFPIIDCPWDGHQTQVRGSACVLLLTPMEDAHQTFVVEYRGEVGSTDCASFGPPGGTGGMGPRVPTLVQ
jgi:uncharacterized protein YozE (UPF0346 family)